MDSRFYKKENVRYDLYPQDTNILDVLSKILISNSKYEKIKLKLDNQIMKLFSVKNDDIHYFASGSKALEMFLKTLVKNKKVKNVYIPSFSCMELADAIIKSDCNIKLYDIEESLKPNIQTLRKIAKDREGVLILTSLFGKNTYSEEFIKVLQEMTIPIILDEAQAFPNISLKLHKSIKKCGILISFGKSKPISAIGGGAIINKELVDNSFLKGKVVNNKNYFKDIYSILKARFNNIIRKRIYGNYKKTDKYSSLEELISDKKEQYNEQQEINKIQIIMAYYRLKKYIQKYKNRKIKSHSIKNLFGDKSLCDYNYLPIMVNNKNRYNIMKNLGEKGIQCTIYYYPIHIIPFYLSKFELEKCVITERIFEQIVIIPFGIDYKNKDLKVILDIVKENNFIR